MVSRLPGAGGRRAPHRVGSSSAAAAPSAANGHVESPGEIGTIAYFCDCTVVDYLADPGRMTPYIERYRAEHAGSPLLAINYLWYQRREPVPAQLRLVYEFAPPGPEDFPTTFPGDVTKRMRLEPVPVSG
jgi:hypothetical protein